jgi:hypothetical protein
MQGLSKDEGGHPESFWTFVVIGTVLLVGTGSLFWQVRQPTARPEPAPVPVIDPAMVPLATGEEPVPDIFLRSGCASCHTIPGIEGAQGRVGPKLVLGSNGPKRLADPAYRGDARTVREYIHESVVNPGAYVVPGFPDQAMPRWYGKKLSAGALDKIAGYLEGLREDSESLVSGH